MRGLPTGCPPGGARRAREDGLSGCDLRCSVLAMPCAGSRSAQPIPLEHRTAQPILPLNVGRRLLPPLVPAKAGTQSLTSTSRPQAGFNLCCCSRKPRCGAIGALRGALDRVAHLQRPRTSPRPQAGPLLVRPTARAAWSRNTVIRGLGFCRAKHRAAALPPLVPAKAGTQSLLQQVVPQIAPGRIHALDELQFPSAVPIF